MNLAYKVAGLIYGPDIHHLDHLAILCELMNIPLIVSEEDHAAIAKKYYPGLKIIYNDYLQLPEYVVKNFSIIFCSIPRDLFDEVFFFSQKLLNKKVHTIWCPHGNSDKGHASFFMEGLKKEEIALVYGRKMIDFLRKKEVFDQLKAYAITGNFRYTYYQRNKEFYKQLIATEIQRRLPQAEKTILYAPTWQDREQSSSFEKAASFLLQSLPSNYNLIVKLHPNTFLKDNIFQDTLIDNFQNLPNLLFIKDFPAIYPLLDFVDVYIGDMSSIGYDFLTFNKPMFFLNPNDRDQKNDQGLYLFRCGIEIKNQDLQNIYSIIASSLPQDKERFSSIRKQVYDYTFGEEKNWEALRQDIFHLYSYFPDEDLSFY